LIFEKKSQGSARPYCHQKCPPIGHTLYAWLSVLFGRDEHENREISD
jgi:hypothetical protein